MKQVHSHYVNVGGCVMDRAIWLSNMNGTPKLAKVNSHHANRCLLFKSRGWQAEFMQQHLWASDSVSRVVEVYVSHMHTHAGS
jgi:hypothetical protein